jgi:hypothetical protein
MKPLKYFKHFRFLVFLWICSIVVVSCKNSNSPQAVTEKFLNSFVRMDLETAKSISTKNTWGFLDIWASFSKQVPEEVIKERSDNFKIKIIGSQKETDSTVVVSYTTEPKILPFNQLRLLRQTDMEGRERWKVDLSTIDLVGGDEMYIEEENKSVEEVMSHESKDSIPNMAD